MNKTMLVTVALITILVVPCAMAQGPRVLFLTKSEGFQHSPVAVKDGQPCLAEKALTALAEENGATVKATKNASEINADNLKNYDLVVFYTQGDLTKPSKDGGDAIGPNGVADLLNWIKEGGRFAGFHSASDTFHTPKDAKEMSPYLKMVGAEFVVHGAQFVGIVKVVDPSHPVMQGFPQDWKIKEEWYTFKDFNKQSMHVLALLDPGEAGAKQALYSHGPYPIIWCSAYGKGKVFFNAMGHRDELWTDPIFTNCMSQAANWLMDPNSSASDTEPNFDKVMASVNKEAPKK